MSGQTDNLSKLSRVFDFDQEVFSTKIYARAFRGSLKTVLRQQQADKTSALQPQPLVGPTQQNHSLDRRVLLLGIGESGKSTVTKQLRILNRFWPGFSIEEIEYHRSVILEDVGNILRECVNIMEYEDIVPVREENRELWEWFKIEVWMQPSKPQLHPQFVDAIRSFWKDPCMSNVLDRCDFCMRSYAP
jgi:hypothetical protein